MNEDNNTEETKLEQALANDDTTTNVMPPQRVSVTFSASAVDPYSTYNPDTIVNFFPNNASGTYVQPSPPLPISGTAYVNISPADFATIRTMIREELQYLKGEIVNQVKDELVKDIRMSTGMRRTYD